MQRMTLKLRTFSVGFVRLVFLFGFAFVILYPVLTMISKAFMQQQDLFDNTVLWIPKHFTLENIKFAWSTMEFPKALMNSVLIVSSTTFLQTMVCMMVGYGFARFRFRGKKLFFAMVILSILLPPQQMMTPLYLHFKSFDFFGLFELITNREPLNLLNTPWPFFILSSTGFGIRNGLFIFMFRQAFRSIPKETEEAALVDGAGQSRVFLQIMIPNAMTVIVTVLLFSCVWQWNDTFYSGLFLNSTRMLPQSFELFNSYLSLTNGERSGEVFVQMSRYNLSDYNVLELLRNSGVFLVMAPLMAFYIFLQRYFVEGIERSGLVG